MSSAWDAVVVGSGIGGLAAAAALAGAGRRVLVLERHSQPGGLTQSFVREGYRFDVGVHFMGGFGPGQTLRRLFDRLSGGRIDFAPIPGAYDRVAFPGLQVAYTPPREELERILASQFPDETDGLQQYFQAVDAAADTMEALFATHSAPALIARPLAWLKHGAIERWVGRTTWEVVCECIRDERLRAVLCAQWGDYGSRPTEGSFGMHALVTRHYFEGAWYPVGGSESFAREFGRTIEAAGGALRMQAEVAQIRVHEQRIRGVTLASGEAIDCDCVISDVGVHATLRLLPAPEVDYGWAADALDLDPSLGYVGLYLGFEGDIAAHGADPANTWFHEQWDVNRVWTDPAGEARAPALLVSFPSLCDPTHDPGPTLRHTGKVIALVDWNVFSRWDQSEAPGGMHKGSAAARSADYMAFKDMLHDHLRAQFLSHFPSLEPMLRFSEVSTPISVATVIGAEHGAMYGLEATPKRFLSPALHSRTPVGGLFLAGQDPATPGVVGAFIGGLMAAANVDRRVWKMLR